MSISPLTELPQHQSVGIIRVQHVKSGTTVMGKLPRKNRDHSLLEGAQSGCA